MAPAPAPSLSRAAVVDAGVALVAEGGMAALSMRRIADRLEVWPTAIYHYVDTREHLAELVVERLVASVELPGGDVAPLEWLRQTAWAMRRVALAHPGMAAYLLEQGSGGPASVAFAERVAGRMAALGFGDHELAYAYNFFVSWVAGAIHKTDRFVSRGGAEGMRRFSDGLEQADAHERPHVARMRGDLRAMMDTPDEPFGWSLALVLEALAARGARSSNL